jgi:gliding motility-associated-like protein
MSNYTWVVSAGGTITAGGGTGNNTVTVTWTTTGAKTITVNYNNTNGCTATSATTYNVTVNALPVPTIAGPTPVCVGVAGNVYTTEAGMSNYTWVVSAGGTITAGGGTANNTVTVTWTTTGAKTVTVNYNNLNGCTATSPATHNVTVNALPVATASNNGPVCEGGALSLTGGLAGMTTYSWTGPNGFTSLLQNPSISANATLAMAGVYTLIVTNASGCTNTITTTVTVNALPVATVSNNGPVCAGSALSLTGGPAGMTTYSWTGPNGFTSLLQNPSVSANATLTMSGVYTLTVTNGSGCMSIASTTVTVNENPVAIAGQDQELTFIFETQMEAELTPPETGEWSLISGSGHISDIHSPTTPVTELSTGENLFLWKVRNGNCEADAEVKITVYDLFVSSVITPDGDGKNDYFKISENIGKVELIIFNRWGNEEYSNSDYKNDWDARNNKGAELPYDTYFYILKLENGKIKKGSVLIKR